MRNSFCILKVLHRTTSLPSRLPHIFVRNNNKNLTNMAGVKGRSGLRKGQTNNPNGRPAGALGKAVKETITATGKKPNVVLLRDAISEHLYENFPSFLERLEVLHHRNPEKALDIEKDLYKMIIPRPSDPKDAESKEALHSAMARFFNIKSEEAEK